MSKQRKSHNDLTTKTINRIEFTAHEYDRKTRKYRITARGYNGERRIGCDTWEKYKDGDITDKRSSLHPENKRWFQTSFTQIVNIPSIIELFPMPLLLNAPKTDLEVVSELCWNLIDKVVIDDWEQTKEEFLDGKDAFDIIQFTTFAFYDLEDMDNNFNRELCRKNLYKKLCKLYHPDNGVYANEEMIKKINCYFK